MCIRGYSTKLPCYKYYVWIPLTDTSVVFMQYFSVHLTWTEILAVPSLFKSYCTNDVFRAARRKMIEEIKYKWSIFPASFNNYHNKFHMDSLEMNLGICGEKPAIDQSPELWHDLYGVLMYASCSMHKLWNWIIQKSFYFFRRYFNVPTKIHSNIYMALIPYAYVND